MNPRYPIYVISKGRWEKRYTVKALEEMKVPYRVVVEPTEYPEYTSVIEKEKLLILPSDFSKMKQGSIPVRNWVWAHSIKEGHDWHWILDDNITWFSRFNNNLKIKCLTGTTFYIIEDFVNRYENIGQAGMNYEHLFPSLEPRRPIYFNTRVYSCILIRNDLPYRWRGKYNEDTDLSLRILKGGWCTALFYAFLIKKRPTLVDKGGNTDTIYNTGDERLGFAQSLAQQHPDCVKIVRRYNRWHHFVDYSKFKNNLLIKKDIEIPNIINEFKMKLKVKNNEPKISNIHNK